MLKFFPLASLLIASLAVSANAGVIRFSGTVDSQGFGSAFGADYRLATDFSGTLEYDPAASNDHSIVQTLSIYIGGSSFIRTANEYAMGNISLLDHELFATDGSSTNTFLEGVPAAFLNETNFHLFWPGDGSPLQRNALDFSQVIGGSFDLHFGLFDPVAGAAGGFAYGTIRNVEVPEPGTPLILAAGVGALLLLRRRWASR